MEVLDAQNWPRWLVRPDASFCARVLFRDGPDQGPSARQCENKKKGKTKKGSGKQRLSETHLHHMHSDSSAGVEKDEG